MGLWALTEMHNSGPTGSGMGATNFIFNCKCQRKSNNVETWPSGHDLRFHFGTGMQVVVWRFLYHLTQQDVRGPPRKTACP